MKRHVFVLQLFDSPAPRATSKSLPQLMTLHKLKTCSPETKAIPSHPSERARCRAGLYWNRPNSVFLLSHPDNTQLHSNLRDARIGQKHQKTKRSLKRTALSDWASALCTRVHICAGDFLEMTVSCCDYSVVLMWHWGDVVNITSRRDLEITLLLFSLFHRSGDGIVA